MRHADVVASGYDGLFDIELLGPRIDVPDGIRLYCLYGADGTPVSISGSREAAFANALEHELTPVSVH